MPASDEMCNSQPMSPCSPIPTVTVTLSKQCWGGGSVDQELAPKAQGPEFDP